MMEREEMAVKIAQHEAEISSLKHRMNDVEDITKSINSLSTNVSVLAERVEQTNKTVIEVKTGLEDIKTAPQKRYSDIVKYIITTIIGLAVGYIFTTMIGG